MHFALRSGLGWQAAPPPPPLGWLPPVRRNREQLLAPSSKWRWNQVSANLFCFSRKHREGLFRAEPLDKLHRAKLHRAKLHRAKLHRAKLHRAMRPEPLSPPGGPRGKSGAVALAAATSAAKCIAVVGKGIPPGPQIVSMARQALKTRHQAE